MTKEEAVNYIKSMGLMASGLAENKPEFIGCKQDGNKFIMEYSLTNKGGVSGYGQDVYTEADIIYHLMIRRFSL